MSQWNDRLWIDPPEFLLRQEYVSLFATASRTVLWATQSSTKQVSLHFPEGKEDEAWRLPYNSHPVPKCNMNTALAPTAQYTFMVWCLDTETTLPTITSI
jgi:hypothetical protein